VNGVAYVLTLSSIALWASTAECQAPASIDPVIASPRQVAAVLDNAQGTATVRILLTEVKSASDRPRAESIGPTTKPSGAVDSAAVMKPVHEFVASFNKGDPTTTDAGCSHVTSILDDFPPHERHGADACRSWMRSYRVYTSANGLADMIITLGSPKHVDVAADRAYVVVPASYTIKVHGTLVNKTNSTVTFALE
jgi:hypothetical protein